MSGGSYDYAYIKINDLAGDISARASTPLRRAFVKHLQLVSQALHDIEWVDSCDKSKGDEDAAIRACIAKDAELRQAIEDAVKAKDELRFAIERAMSLL